MSDSMEANEMLPYEDSMDSDSFDDPVGLTDISSDSLESGVISSAASRKNNDNSDGMDENLESVSPLSDDSVKMYLREIGPCTFIKC